ncbi:MAG: hypothetical protein OXC31_19985 [Spirochaetaceae bacterium]|nr:hypothetical protein [Spirochaetaceae bacterium]
MAKLLQIRNVPDDLHRRLKARSARADMSMSDYVLRAEAMLVTPVISTARPRCFPL